MCDAHQICLDERPSHTASVQNQVPRHSRSGSIDGPGDSFHKYLTKEADKVKRGESQREDAHEVLIFVCLLHSCAQQYPNVDIVGCPTRSHSCDTYRRIYPRPPIRPARQMGFLSRENLRTAYRGRQRRISRFPPFLDPHRP
jgi:hypothetical protein